MTSAERIWFMFCIKCGSETQEYYDFCPECGTPICPNVDTRKGTDNESSSTTVPMNVHISIREKREVRKNSKINCSVFCTECGEAIDDGYEFCPNCGTRAFRSHSLYAEQPNEDAYNDIIDNKYTGYDVKNDVSKEITEPDRSTLYCTECGALTDDRYDFCPLCGAKLFKESIILTAMPENQMIIDSPNDSSEAYEEEKVITTDINEVDYNNNEKATMNESTISDEATKFDKDTVYCTECGSALNDACAFCPECGKAVFRGIQSISDTSERDNKINHVDNGKNTDKNIFDVKNASELTSKMTYIAVAILAIIAIIAIVKNAHVVDDHNGNASIVLGGEGFVSDWRSGYENKYGYGDVINWNCAGRYMNYVTQDQWLYYSSYGKIYKMPVGGSANDVTTIYCAPGDMWETIEISVVKDWVYFMLCYGENTGGLNQYNGLYRIRTDGQLCECLVSADNIDPWSRFYVVEDDVYYIGQSKSGAQSSNYSLVKLNVDDRNQLIISDVPKYCKIVSGYKDSMFIEHYSFDDEGSFYTTYIVDLKGNILLPICYGANDYPILYNRYDSFIITKGGWGLIGGGGAVHFENTQDYNSNIKWENETTCYAATCIDVSNGYIYADKSSPFIYRGDWNESPSSGLCVVDMDDYSIRNINNDRGIEKIVCWGDGYIYYNASEVSGDWSYSPKDGNVVRYRVKPDGSGFEDVYWMYP